LAYFRGCFFFRSKTRHPTANSYIEAARQSAYLFYSQITITYLGLHFLFSHDTAHVRSKNHESICMSRPSLLKYCALINIVIILGFMLHHSAFPNLKSPQFFIFLFLSVNLVHLPFRLGCQEGVLIHHCISCPHLAITHHL
jgi:hypothetical protein